MENKLVFLIPVFFTFYTEMLLIKTVNSAEPKW